MLNTTKKVFNTTGNVITTTLDLIDGGIEGFAGSLSTAGSSIATIANNRLGAMATESNMEAQMLKSESGKLRMVKNIIKNQKLEDLESDKEVQKQLNKLDSTKTIEELNKECEDEAKAFIATLTE